MLIMLGILILLVCNPYDAYASYALYHMLVCDSCDGRATVVNVAAQQSIMLIGCDEQPPAALGQDRVVPSGKSTASTHAHAHTHTHTHAHTHTRTHRRTHTLTTTHTHTHTHTHTNTHTHTHMRRAPAHIDTGTWAYPATSAHLLGLVTSAPGLGLTPPTSAPGLGRRAS
jgi:hypothetical protein